jgi:hypothetical protein
MTDPERWIDLHEAELRELIPLLDGRRSLIEDAPELLDALRRLVVTS